MENTGAGIEYTQDPSIGRVIPEFRIDYKVLERARSYVESSRRYYESQRQSWSQKLREMDRAYRCMLEDDRPYRGFDDKCSPIIHDNVETVVARLKESVLFQKKSLVRVTSKQIPPELLEFRSDQLNKQLMLNDIEKKAETLCRITAKYGTGFVKCVYLDNESIVLTRQLTQTQEIVVDELGQPVVNELGQPIVKTVTQVVRKPEIDRKYVGPSYDVINDIEDIYLDMFIEDIQSQQIVIHRLLVSWDHLMEGVERGIYFAENVNKVKDMTYASSSLITSRSQEVLGGTAQNIVNNDSSTGKPRLYEIFQAYCDFAVPVTLEDGSQSEQVHKCVITICGSYVIQLMPNPYFHQMIPIIKATYRSIEGEAYGIGCIDPVLSIFHEYNDTNNLKNDARVLALNPIKIQRASSMSDSQNLDIAPGVTWLEKNTGDIRVLTLPWEPVLSGEQSLELLEQRINRGMGITPLLMGQGDATDIDKTWRGTNKLISQSDKKFKLISKSIEDAAVRQWAELAYKINLQFSPIRIGGDFETINSETTFVVDGVESFFEKIEQMTNLQSFLQLFGNIPGVNIVGLMHHYMNLIGLELNPSFGPIYTPPQPTKEDKPLSVSVSVPIDPSKGVWAKYAASQILAEKGIVLDLDSIRGAQEFDRDDDTIVKIESGNLPPRGDSYPRREIKEAN